MKKLLAILALLPLACQTAMNTTAEKLEVLPKSLNGHRLTLSADGNELIYTYDSQKERTGITNLLKDLADAGVRFKDLHTTQSSLEDIFVDLVRQKR